MNQQANQWQTTAYKIIRNESAINLFGLQGRAFNVVANETHIRNQQIMVSRTIGNERLDVTLRFDDECNNGHESFAITGTLRDTRKAGERGIISCGCVHDDIRSFFPELAHLIKWHLTSTNAPVHYVDNALYFAGDMDCNGLQKGEKRQIKNGRTGLPCWHLVAVDEHGNEIDLYKLGKSIDAESQPACPYTIEYRPWCRVGEGKEREFDKARSAAVWPDATDDQLSLPREELKQLLVARLPGLTAEFKAAMLECGFLWPSRLNF